ncbi:hypothetical protein BC940DRAFT_314087 [Gongronella butleri]|nr:hypothetical protein BC940DRAFT_314087 [Gongronella butleri]
MVDKSKITLQKLARWHPSQTSMNDRKRATNIWDGVLHPIEHEELKQGDLYIIKIHIVSIGLFQGWNDDMCCFSVLRSESHPLRWSLARYLPGDFDAYPAFDFAGNPTVHLWHKYLRADVPVNWFVLFEEARRKQREWNAQILAHHHQAMPAVRDPVNVAAAAAAAHHHHQHLHQHDDMDDTYSALSPSRHSEEHLSSISSLPIDSRPIGLQSPAVTPAPTSPTSPTMPMLPPPLPNQPNQPLGADSHQQTPHHAHDAASRTAPDIGNDHEDFIDHTDRQPTDDTPANITPSQRLEQALQEIADQSEASTMTQDQRPPSRTPSSKSWRRSSTVVKKMFRRASASSQNK